MRPRTSTSAARAGEAGMRRLPASRLPVPPGTRPSATSVPTSAAAACMVVPSPPNTATRSTASRTPYSARRRASPGPPVASTSVRQPAARSASSTTFTASGSVRAAAGLVMSSAVAILELSLPEHVRADLVAIGRQKAAVPGDRAGAEGRLEAGLEAPCLAEAVLEARAEVLGAERRGLRRPAAEAGVERDEASAPDAPPEGKPAHRRSTGGGDARLELHVVDGHAEIGDEEPLDLAGEGGQRALDGGLLARRDRIRRRSAEDEIRREIRLRNGGADRALQRQLGDEQRAGDPRDHRNLLVGAHRPHDVLRRNVELGVQVGRAEVAHRSLSHAEVAGDRPDLERVGPPDRLERAHRTILPLELA